MLIKHIYALTKTDKYTLLPKISSNKLIGKNN